MGAACHPKCKPKKDPRLHFSPVGFGCWQLGSRGKDDYWGLKFTDDLAKSLVSRAVCNKITYFDTAECYSQGASERQLGLALKELDKDLRSQVIVGSKVLPNNCSDVRKALKGTLDRLGMKSIDLYMVHWPITKRGMAHFAGDNKDKPSGIDYAKSDAKSIKEVPATAKAFEELVQLQKEGFIKHIGVSNFGVKQLKEALATGVKIAVNQVAYSLLFRAIEFEVLPFCREHGIEVLCYSPLMQGLLTGRYKCVSDVPGYRSRTRHFDSRANKLARHGEIGCEKLLFETVERIRKIADASGHSMVELALAWPLAQAGVSCVIAGATKVQQVDSNAAAAKTLLSRNVIKALSEATEELKRALGPNIDMYQGVVDGVNTSRCF
mmetsp:Transcript_22277/g.41809  ORF Transcript_22277/g.41809 Transcript_22277/m.41809 type:complete len:380 (-) Transcript_22277:147-1286(-)